MVVVFPDRPDFKPDYTPYEIFSQGAFQDHINEQGIAGYWRPIYSRVLNKNLEEQYLKYDWGDLHLDKLVNNKPNINKNKFRVKAGSSLQDWEDKGWIYPEDPYGWVQWFCEFFSGRRIPEYDDYQIQRWKKIKKRFMGMKNTPVVKQTLLNWAIKA